MKKILFVALGLSLACNSSQKTISQQIEPVKSSIDPMVYAQTITEAELKEHLYTYASDEFEGRDTGEPGQKLAVEYLKSEYVELGIPAAQTDGNYFQNVPLVISKLPKGAVTINGKEYQNGEGLLTFTAATGSYDNIVYVNYGIEEEDYSDYAGLDVKGKLVLMKAGEPINADGTYTLSGSKEASVWSNMSESIGKRMELAASKGAIGVMYFDPANFGRFKNRFNFMQGSESGSMGLKDEVQDDFYSFFIDADVANAILPNIKSENTSKNVSTKLILNIQSDSKDVESENVVAVIKGSEKPDEYVIISAHLDHVGVNNEGEIYNGADDDGSGTVGLLEIAEAFKKAADEGYGPKRSVVFLHVTGEEKGLLGSKYYADHDPIFPLSQTVADLNIDMIGRIDPNRKGERNYIYLIGSDKLSTELHNLSEEVNKKYMNIELDYTFNDENDPNRFYYRSDHYNFAKNNIPIIFYFNGTHADYHQPGDTPDKINYDLLENRTRLVFLTAWEIANRDARLKVDKATR
ncbi:M28 family metallopeptidase [Arenibacter echinorum]|uniref:Zn-dependent M28 family amino/carboxypeptidase n=1 Tax=Arenibacter echinorum TaxID=440515 RepID=A0A327R6T6_9FLAO|nr:M28 family metallopeptidase [Arenibacter echinorum]RAJ12600.1 Zn-dependent M28 family amino/carboxypeptidase [Arenibacter echinorum]